MTDEGFVPIEDRPSARRSGGRRAAGRPVRSNASAASGHGSETSDVRGSQVEPAAGLPRESPRRDRASTVERRSGYGAEAGEEAGRPAPYSRSSARRDAPSDESAYSAYAGAARRGSSARAAGIGEKPQTRPSIPDALGDAAGRLVSSLDPKVVRIAAIAALVLLVVLLATSIARCTSSGTGTDAASVGDAGVSQGSIQVSDDQAQVEVQVAEAPAEVEPVTIETLMVGDILVHRGVWESGEMADGTRNYDHLFAHVADQLAAADLKIVDQETVLGGDAFEISGYPMFNSPQEIGDAEVKAGFNCILRASNHSMDMWDDGLKSELTFWRTKHPEMLVVGAVMPEVETAAEAGPVYYEKDGFRVAILNYAEDLNGMPDYSDAVCEIDEAQIRRDVAIAEENADLTIVCPHWGYEGSFTPNDFQRYYAQLMCDLGVDVVFGNHPHVMQPVEVVTSSDGTHRMPVFWSVGNFVSTMVDPENTVAVIAKATLVKDADGARVEAYAATPIVTHRSYGEDMTTFLLKDYTDELAWTNSYWGTEDLPFPEYCNDLCSDVLGSAYDPVAHELYVKM